MIVWVLKDNPARTFYEKMGGKYLEAKCLESYQSRKFPMAGKTSRC